MNPQELHSEKNRCFPWYSRCNQILLNLLNRDQLFENIYSVELELSNTFGELLSVASKEGERYPLHFLRSCRAKGAVLGTSIV